MVSYHSLLVLWVCFFSIVSCSSDDIIDQYGSRLVQISTTTTDNYEERTNLHYDQTGKVLTVEDFAQNLKFYIEYKDDKILKHTSHYFHTPNSINAIDSFIYDQNGKLDKVNLYRRLSLALKLSFEIDYIYDGHDMPSERKTIFLGSGKIVSAQKFFWRNNNLLKIQYFNHENNMEGETEFQYDKLKNYKKLMPIISTDPLTLCENNVISFKFNSVTDPSQLQCNPCVFKYKYNRDKYPVEIIHPIGKTEMLVYK